ncbi:hypothetical protein [Mucilaginibacter sp. OK098]|uniref:hypothetical protein n=1 Tax=Mucilaginibacter sp. OK098 TaxID=1855297 RepID=UPI0011611D7D|nr:hypothetical protein [Mucilaginibacter sp. OK098]
MKTDLMKVTKAKSWLLTLLLLTVVSFAFAQKVNISTSIFPPYSPYYSDYSGINASKVLVIVQNLTSNTLKIKLSGKLESRSVDIHTRENFIPLQPVVLLPHAVVQLNGSNLKDIFDANNLSVKGIDIATLAQSSRLPEGDYSFCINAIDYSDNKTVLSTPGVGCTFLPIVYPDAPVLASPGKTVTATNPQSVIFSWFNPAATPFGTQYHIEIAEMPDGQSDPNHVLDATSFPILSQNVSSFSYLYGALNLQLIPGKKYAWRVTAFDPLGKTVFKHNGISPASYFTYVPAVSGQSRVQLASAGNLFIINPACDSSVTIGQHVKLQMGWLWKNQLESIKTFGTLDSVLLNHYTEIAGAKGPIKLGKYVLDFEKVPGGPNPNARKSFSYSSNAPLQNFDLTYIQALAQGFVIGEKYKVTVTSYDQSGVVIDKATSCPWLLKGEVDSNIPKLTITGRLVYTLDKTGAPHGTNNTSITVQLADSQQQQPISNFRANASVTTDNDGYFTIQVTQSSADAGKGKYLNVRINSPYYSALANNVPILEVPAIQYVVKGNIVTPKQDTLKLGDIKTVAFTNSLTVHLKKGFPKTIGKSDYETLFGTDPNYSYLSVDNATIDTMGRIPDGTRVVLYRKAKANDIPYYEADTVVGKPLKYGFYQASKKLAETGIDPSYLFVADATTHNGAIGASTVVFSNLLCNFDANDQYYIKAILPNAPADLVAPEQMYVFKPANYGIIMMQHITSTDYHIISSKPPTAHVKGKLMYQWPSLPGVLHPYANKNVSIAEHIHSVLQGGLTPDPCQTVTYKKITPKPGGGLPIITDYDISNENDNIVVGQGVTDADGNYDIEIFTPNKAGPIPGVKVFASGDPCPPPNKDKDYQIAQAQAAPAPNINGDPLEKINSKINQGQQAISPGSGADGGLTGLGASKLLQIPAANGAPLDFSRGANGVKQPVNVNKGLNGTFGADAKPLVDKGAASGKAVGPSDNDDTTDETDDPDLTNHIERYYGLDGLQPGTFASYDHAPLNFEVQPFQTINLGTTVINVPELKNYTVHVTTKDIDSTNILAGAIVTVYRNANYNEEFVPDGEGSFKHPSQPLPANNIKSDPANPNVEWVIDHSFKLSIDGAHGHTVNIGDQRLMEPRGTLGKYTQYRVQVAPDNTNVAGNFFPKSDFLTFKKGNLLELEVISNFSRISGRVLNHATQKPLAGVDVILATDLKKADGKPMSIDLKTDNNGFYEVDNFQLSEFYWKDGDKLTISLFKVGYGMQLNAANSTLKGVGYNYYNELSLSPDKTQNFTTVDAGTNLPVAGAVMTTDSTIFYSDPNTTGLYSVPMSSTVVDTVHVYPTDVAYFEEKIPVSSGATIPAYIKLYKRHHHMVFQLRDEYNAIVNVDHINIIINNIHISNDVSGLGILEAKQQLALYKNYHPIYDQATQTISFDFENVSVNNFSIQIINTGAEGYIPQVFNLKNTESRDNKYYPITLRYGASVGGWVTYNGQKVSNARVYLDYSGQSEVSYDGKDGGTTDKSLLEARTDAKGHYRIRGIPISYDHQLVQVHATLDTDKMVNGIEKSADLRYGGDNNIATASFDLVSYGGPKIKNLYGFPLTVENIEKLSPSSYKISGIVDLGKSNSGFKMLSGSDKIRVNDVVFDAARGGGFEPTDKAIPLEATNTLKMQYLGQYNVKVQSPNETKGITTPLTIEKGTQGGLVKAHVSIVDNSFNYPSSYLNFTPDHSRLPISFHLVNSSDRLTDAEKLLIAAIYSAKPLNEVYHLADSINKPLMFKFIGFPTTADPVNSYINPADKLIHLDINFQANIPHSELGYANIHIKDMALDGYSIKPTKGADAIVVNLQTWQLIVKEWTIDPKLGGILSQSAYVKTGVVDVPANHFNLRNDLFELGEFDVKNITLGGGLVALNGINPKTTAFLWDENCGSDHKAHWRFSAIGSADGKTPAATVPLPDVPGKFSASTVNVDFFQLLSYNNENLISLSPNQEGLKMYNNNLFTFYPSSLLSEIGQFAVRGTANINVPRVADQAMSLVYTKTNGTFDANAGGFDAINFEGKGYVQFTTDPGATFTVDGNMTSIKGKVVEPGKFNAIPCSFSFGQQLNNPDDPNTNWGKILLQQGYKLRMDGDGVAGPADSYLTITDSGNADNRMVVDHSIKDWNILSFTGPVTDPKTNDPNGGQADAMQSTPTVLTFNVLGDLQVNSGAIQMNKINTPLGNLDLIYDFALHELRGALHMDKLAIGTYSFTGDIQVTMGPKGLLMVGNGLLDTGILPVDGFGIINIGILFGNTDLKDDDIATVTKYSMAKNSLCWLLQNRSGFKGFFFTGGLTILDKHESVNLGIAAVSFNANLGVEASLGANFGGKNYMLMLGAHGSVNAGLTSMTGTTIQGGLDAHLTAEAQYTDSAFEVDGDAGVTINFKLSQYIPFLGTQSINGQKGAKINFKYKKNDSHLTFSMADDGNAVICTQNGDIQ